MPYERLNQIISTSKSENRLFIVDACKSGSWAVDDVLAPKGTKLDKEDALALFYKRMATSGNGMSWLLACKPDELSADDGNFRRGAFTAYLLKALKGGADVDNDNIITLNEAATYLQLRFNEYNKDHEGQFWPPENEIPVKQTPVLKSINGNLNMPLSVRAGQ